MSIMRSAFMRKMLVVLCVLLILPVSSLLAAEQEVSLIGPDRILAREVFRVSLLVNTADVSEIRFDLGYDTENLIFSGIDTDDKNWEYIPIKNQFAVRRKTESLPAEGQICVTLVFRLRDVAVGTKFWVQFADTVVTAGGKAREFGTLSWEQSSARPISDDNYLAQLTLSAGELQPQFRATQLNYSVHVPYEVETIDVTALARSEYATVAITNPALIPGTVTELTVIVTAENGVQRIYRIRVTREEPPLPTESTEAPTQETYGDSTEDPADKPTNNPSADPTEKPSEDPTEKPSKDPTEKPSENPTEKPTVESTDEPLSTPTEVTNATGKTPTDETEQTEPQTVTLPGEEIDIPSWVYIVVAVIAVTGISAVGILISDRKK